MATVEYSSSVHDKQCGTDRRWTSAPGYSGLTIEKCTRCGWYLSWEHSRSPFCDNLEELEALILVLRVVEG
jgi:hypothetical protein